MAGATNGGRPDVSILDDARKLIADTAPTVAHRETAPDLVELRGPDVAHAADVPDADRDVLAHLDAYHRKLLDGMRGLVLPPHLATAEMREAAARNRRIKQPSAAPEPRVRCWEREP